MSPLPVGTLTLLFSDIEGSTSLLTGLGARWADALSAHRTIMREAFRAHGGVEVGTEGDSFFVVFTSATEAVEAAIAAQRGLAARDWPDGQPIRVRIGLHTGEPQPHEDNYIGIDIHRAARIMATAHGGQVVISDATYALAGEALRGLTVRDLGWHRLKDITEPEHLYDVGAADLPGEHPPLRSLGRAATLPSYTTTLVGRETELSELMAALETEGARLVTLLGPGGTGKTRLAVAVARELQDRIGHDVFFVPLETADRAALMWAGIAEAVGAPMTTAEQPPEERVLGFLRTRAALLVLDNLEQISDADLVVSRLLTDAPDVCVLTTSRRPLHLVAERQYPLSMLTLPGQPAGAASVAQAEQSPAVRLFVERARLVRPGFVLTPENAADVVGLCRRLDGLPLAIELAAARTRLLSPKALLSRIDSWLGGDVPAADRPERQRTLDATISWSYELLADADRQVFRRLGVFSGRVGLEAVEAVAASGAGDPLDAVGHLVDVSLLEVVEGPDGEPMIYLLETIRRFARARLDEHAETDEVRLRHAEWCVSTAVEITSLLHGPRQMTALDRMEAVIEDVRAALDWTLVPDASAAPERLWAGLSLLQPMDAYWYRFGYVQEGRGWHGRALAVIDSGEWTDSVGIVDALHGHGVLAIQQDDIDTAVQALERALEMARRLGDATRESRESNSLGVALRERGDVEAARGLILRSLDLAKGLSDPRRRATALSNIVLVHIDAGEYAAAVDAARRAIATDEALEDPWGVAVDRSNLVTALLLAEGPVAAFRELVDLAPSAITLGDIELSIDVLDSFAAVWAAFGSAGRAAAMLGAADRHREEVGIPRTGPDRAILDHFVDRVRRGADAAAWHDAYGRGRDLSIESAVSEGSVADQDLQHALQSH